MSPRFKDFELRPCGEINGKHHTLELVKWCKSNGEERCYVVAWIDWNDREPCWEFRSVGTRFIDDYEDGLCEYIKRSLKLLELINECDKEVCANVD